LESRIISILDASRNRRGRSLLSLMMALALLASAWPVVARQATGFPNFSGEWRPRDPDRNDMYFNVGLSELSGGGTLTIAQDARTLVVTRTIPAELAAMRKAIGTHSGQTSTSVSYALPSSASASPAASNAKDRVTWEGNTLIVFKSSGILSGVEERYTLVGSELRAETQVIDAYGGTSSRFTLWYRK
jgi:hypothetical protein